MNLKRHLRLIMLAFLIGLACILPVPITFTRKDDVPKYLIEQIDKNKNDDEENDLKELL